MCGIARIPLLDLSKVWGWGGRDAARIRLRKTRRSLILPHPIHPVTAPLSALSPLQGYTRCHFKAPILPHTTIRGAASLDWTKRAGNYAQVWAG